MNDGSQNGLVVYTWFDQPGTLDLQVGGGYIAHYRDRGHVKVSLYPEPEALPEPVAFDNSVPPDGVKRPVSLTTPDVGLHRLEMNDGGDSSVVIWPVAVRNCCCRVRWWRSIARSRN